jgi:hypothetical protein
MAANCISLATQSEALIGTILRSSVPMTEGGSSALAAFYLQPICFF